MRYLLDTHALLWFDSSPEKLSSTVLDILLNENNELYLSHASLWEIQIKYQLDKIKLETDLKTLIESQQQVNGLQLLDIKAEHIYALGTLPPHHRDPFDRMLISQAMTEKMSLITIDKKIILYQEEVNWIW
ncbi:MAG TPA: type II toxin-antitoxin system VapC family toxin [Aeromonadales bacterium]|nr:type II toxin-antitoxin system VapC family toxin [Aeromonadales bacterium]